MHPHKEFLKKNPNYYHSKMSILVWAFSVPLNDFKVKYTFRCHDNTKPLSNNIEIIVQNNKSQKWISKVWKKEKKDGTNIPIHGRQKDIAFPQI
jgi:hypothetical protein